MATDNEVPICQKSVITKPNIAAEWPEVSPEDCLGPKQEATPNPANLRYVPRNLSLIPGWTMPY
ncbi:MAG: hypothetical protein JAZ17_22240 [Candidatus Thiodiazotropha endolucinida]|nr:hypothetical protein [Candidatus Thiodiazotropha endolucinida]